MVSVIAWLFSCGSADPKQEILAALKEDPQRAIETAKQIEDPLERTMIITELVEAFPNRTRPLCDALPSEISRQRCTRLNQRPHLWKPQKDHLNIQIDPISPLTEKCALDPHPTTCRTAQAQQFARQRMSAKAMAACAAIPEERWQSECYFTIAEDLSRHLDLYAQAIEACDRSRQFAKSCWHHSVMGLAQQAEEHWNDWTWHQQTIDLINQFWQPRDPEMNTELQSHFWAQSIHRHLEKGRLKPSSLPPEALPHYRSSKAIETIRFANHPLQDLQAWVDLVQQSSIDHKAKPRGFASEMDLWLPKYTHPQATVVSYLGNSHRLSHPDPIVDWTIAVLEASARLRPVQKILLLEGSKHAHPVVQATADRLAQVDLMSPPDRQEERK